MVNEVIIGRLIWEGVELYQEYRENNAFLNGVRETTDLETVFIDPDVLLETPEDERGAAMRDMLDRQVPGITDALMEKMARSEDDPMPEDAENVVANKIATAGPMAVMGGVEVNGTRYAVTSGTMEDFDTKAEMFEAFLGSSGIGPITDEIMDNFPGNRLDYIEIFGNHEGEHSDALIIPKSPEELLTEEARADRAAITNLESEGRTDLALALKDLRALAPGNLDAIHATGPLLSRPEEATAMHITVAESYREGMDTTVDSFFDWDNYEGEGEATNAQELLLENPDAYFETVNADLQDMHDTIRDAYENGEPWLNADVVRAAEISTDYVENFEDAYRRRVMGQDIPERAPAQILPPDATFPEPEFEPEPAPDAAPELAAPEPAAQLSGFSGSDAAYDGDPSLLREMSEMGFDINPDLMPDNPELYTRTVTLEAPSL